MQTVQEVRRESAAGFHFINTYQNCPRRWHLRYNLGILPRKLGKALIFGKAWHNALEVIYRKGSAEDAYAKLLSELSASREEYRYADEAQADMLKAEALFPAWFDAIGAKLHEDYEVLAVEEQLEPVALGVARMTIRPDAVVKRKSDGALLIAEHKSTSASLQKMCDSVDTQDQATAYSWGLLTAKPEYKLNFAGVLLDVAYIGMYKGRPASTGPSCQQTIIYRNDWQLGQFELGMAGLFSELTQKKRALAAETPGTDAYNMRSAMLFPRNGSMCSVFGCEYADICRTNITDATILPTDYTVEPWTGEALS